MEQIKSLLGKARELYLEIKEHYDSIEKKSHRVRVEMLLEYLKEHADRQAQALEDFESLADDRVKNEWVNFCPHQNRWHLVENPALNAEDTGGIIEEALNFNDAIIELYREIACNVESESARSLFQNLESHAKKERNRFIRDAMMIEEY